MRRIRIDLGPFVKFIEKKEILTQIIEIIKEKL